MRLFLSFVLPLVLVACATPQHVTQDPDVRSRSRQLEQFAAPKTVSVIHGQYLGAVPVPISGQQLPSLFSERLTLRATATLPELASRAGSVMGIRIRVDDDLAEDEEKLALQERFPLSYDGPFQGLLDTLASRAGMDWEYISEKGEVVLSRFQTRTFTLATAPGNVRYEAVISNRSSGDGDRGQSLGSGVGQIVSGENATHQTSQANRTKFEADAWAETEKGLQGLISSKGRVVKNLAAGTFTVTDTYSVLRRVEAYMDRINAKLSRQVTLGVKVWALDVSDDTELGLDLRAAFSDSNLSIAMASGAPYTTLGNSGSLSATLLNKTLNGSQAMLRALKQLGKTTLVTSGKIVTTSGRPSPLQAMQNDSYLASVATDTNDYSQTTTMIPGQETTGFAMTVLPHILDKRRVILECDISLSSLDELDEYESGDAKIQLPKTSSRSFSPCVNMMMGQTLILGGFEKERRASSKGASLLTIGGSNQTVKTILIITIDVESLEA